MGIDELSVSAPFISDLKQAIAGWSLQEARQISEQALHLDSVAAVRNFLAECLLL